MGTSTAQPAADSAKRQAKAVVVTFVMQKMAPFNIRQFYKKTWRKFEHGRST